MKIYFKVLSIFILVFLVIEISQNSYASEPSLLWSTLTAAQQEALHAGKQILVMDEVPNAIWPRFHIYGLVSAAPRDVEAVFWDVKDDVNYVPDCMKVTVDSCPAPNIVEASYYLNVPFLPQEVSRVRTEVTLLPHGVYNNTWTVLSSKYSQSGSGSFLIIPYKKGSLICYTNFVVPKSSIACILRSQAESQLRATVKAIAERVVYQLKETPQHHALQLQELDAALKTAH